MVTRDRGSGLIRLGERAPLSPVSPGRRAVARAAIRTRFVGYPNRGAETRHAPRLNLDHAIWAGQLPHGNQQPKRGSADHIVIPPEEAEPQFSAKQ